MTYDEALRRVEEAKRSGRWPGIVCHKDGTYSLTSDTRQPDTGGSDA